MNYLITLSTLFVIGSLLGYGIELLFRRFVSQKRWVNPGFLMGPYIPIYGFGVILLAIFSGVLKETSLPTWALHLTSVCLIGISLTVIELVAGLIFIKGLHLKLWDYSDRWGNFKGVICPLFSLIWFVVGCLYYFFLNGPLTDAVHFVCDNLAYSYFIGIVMGMILVDTAFSIHLGLKLRKLSEGLIIRYENFKTDIRDSSKDKIKTRYLASQVNYQTQNNSIKDIIKKNALSAKIKIKKKDKMENKEPANSNQKEKTE